MIRRILAGAAIAAAALGFSASGALADGPNAYNSGQNILSQFSALNDVSVLNKVLNDSIKYVDLISILDIQDVNANVLSSLQDVKASDRS
ncbi:hypothetical protein C1J01_06800 [Nonomuraea aridisoli]|uniref:Fasciclin domain-containing protein n=2 Tax=Nonomuraea aridisoli TaxID=2070368 RepID=A0A2W2EB49_9ACTN|nr:hypothetical protein C1J01_06800 [Nonomuraea aridisoli]